MPVGKPGADSTPKVTHTIGGRNIIDLASDLFGEVPLFWGRYFKGLHKPSDFEYVHRDENPVLNQKNVRLLPIAQQTNFVGGSANRGASDARLNVEDVIVSLGVENFARQGNEYLLFLDVEPTHPMSKQYFSGWARTVISESLR